MKSLINFSLFLSTLFFLSCDCEDLMPLVPTPTEVDNPIAFQLISVDPDAGITSFFCSFEFSEPIDTNSFILFESILEIGLADGPNFPLELTHFSPTEIFISGTPDCAFDDICANPVIITFKGTGGDLIRSADGQILDGDGDGLDGGDYVAEIPLL